MKCPRCQTEMKRRKLKERQIQYKCPKCGYSLGAKDQEDQEAFNEAYAEQMGKG